MQGCSTVSHVEVAAVSDALKQIAGKKVYITHRMRPIYPMRFASYALTVSSKREANDDPDALKAMLQAIDDGTPNSVYVMVVENGNHKCRDGRINGHCHGSQTLFRRSDRRRGRDTAYLQKIGFPVYALGVVPSTSVGHYRFFGANVPVTCDGVPVNPAASLSQTPTA